MKFGMTLGFGQKCNHSTPILEGLDIFILRTALLNILVEPIFG